MWRICIVLVLKKKNYFFISNEIIRLRVWYNRVQQISLVVSLCECIFRSFEKYLSFCIFHVGIWKVEKCLVFLNYRNLKEYSKYVEQCCWIIVGILYILYHEFFRSTNDWPNRSVKIRVLRDYRYQNLIWTGLSAHLLAHRRCTNNWPKFFVWWPYTDIFYENTYNTLNL